MIKKTVIIAVIFSVSLFFYWHELNEPANSNGREQVFAVQPGQAVSQIAANLHQENLIKSVFYFKYLVWRDKLSIQAGEYAISPRLTAKEIVKIMTAGQVISQEKSIRIIEGWNIKDINNYLNANKIVAKDSFSVLASRRLNDSDSPAVEFPELFNGAPKSATLEGFLFPDTYRIFNDATSADIIDKMLANFNKKLDANLRAEIKRQGKTVYEIVTMASVIEKEVRSQADMRIVSGIFWDRIKTGQALNSCATLAYILGVNKPQYSLEDTKIDSPYNTYKYRGLPPGPIANPGLNAIKAAIYPEATGYNYFLSDPATGKTIYSRTLDEHNLNKAKYLK